MSSWLKGCRSLPLAICHAPSGPLGWSPRGLLSLHAAVRMESDEPVMNQVMKMTTTKAKGHGP